MILWTLSYPGKVYIHIDGISINKEGPSFKWQLIANDHRAKSKRDVAKEVEELDIERFKAFLAPAIWGDGYINDDIKFIRLTIGLSKYDLWYEIIERLVNELGFTLKIEDYTIVVENKPSKAVKLVRDWLTNPDIRELIELGASLPDGEKLRRIIELASMGVKERGSSSINIPGTNIGMNVHIMNSHVNLQIKRRNKDDALKILEELKRARYNPSLRITGTSYVVAITHTEIRDDPRLKEPVCQKLSEWLKNEKNEKRKGRIAMVVQNLVCPDTDQFALKWVKEESNRSINIPGTDINMNIHIYNYYKVELRTWRKDKDKALRIYEELKRAGYDPSIRVANDGYEIAILYSEVREKPELREPVCDYLRGCYERLPSDDVEGRWRYAKAMRKLKCPDIGE
ncbi:MAG: hypothetical protein ACP5GZ_08125 [Vulcanisaeta sp.]|uniref:hypothetical protein n=1 Tax=Vulcanisaeta sp. TaxID=2020871 RepID=UPI003D0D77AF